MSFHITDSISIPRFNLPPVSLCRGGAFSQRGLYPSLQLRAPLLPDTVAPEHCSDRDKAEQEKQVIGRAWVK